MSITRRAALCGLLTAGATAAGLTPTSAAVLPTPPADAVGMLYDTTLCIGCKACVVACQDANGLPRDPTGLGPLYDAPVDLNDRAKNVIKLYHDGGQRSFVKMQCMHCIFTNERWPPS